MQKFWKSARRWLPGALISLIAIILILKFVDLQKLVDSIRSANYWLLLAALIMSLVWLGVRAIVWRTLLRNKASYRQTFLTVCEGYLLNNFLPFRLGEVGRAFLLARKAKLEFMEVLPTIVIERAVDLAFAAVLLLAAIPFVVGAAAAGQTALLLGAAVLAGLVFMYFLARKQVWAMGQYERISAGHPALVKIGKSFLEPLFSGLAILTDGWLFVRFLLWMTLNWILAIFQYFLLILAFFPQAKLVWSMFVLGVASFGNAIPSAPGAVGTYEGALSWALTLVTNNASAALAVAVVGHLINYVNTGVIGLYALSNEGETLMSVYRQLRRRQEVNE